MRTITVLERASNLFDTATAHERRGEWKAAADKYRRASALFVEARAWSEAEDALRRAGTCSVVAAD